MCYYYYNATVFWVHVTNGVAPKMSFCGCEANGVDPNKSRLTSPAAWLLPSCCVWVGGGPTWSVWEDTRGEGRLTGACCQLVPLGVKGTLPNSSSPLGRLLLWSREEVMGGRRWWLWVWEEEEGESGEAERLRCSGGWEARGRSREEMDVVMTWGVLWQCKKNQLYDEMALIFHRMP